MKIIYIAHPIGGDVEGNIKKVLQIVQNLNRSNPDIVPFAPYIVDVQALDDTILSDRNRGFKNNKFLFQKCVDEVWLFGDKISNGMKQEIEWANELGVKVIDYTNESN